MANVYEVFFTETVRSKVYIKADSIEEAEEIFDGGDYDIGEVYELEAYNAEIEEIEECNGGV